MADTMWLEKTPLEKARLKRLQHPVTTLGLMPRSFNKNTQRSSQAFGDLQTTSPNHLGPMSRTSPAALALQRALVAQRSGPRPRRVAAQQLPLPCDAELRRAQSAAGFSTPPGPCGRKASEALEVSKATRGLRWLRVTRGGRSTPRYTWILHGFCFQKHSLGLEIRLFAAVSTPFWPISRSSSSVRLRLRRSRGWLREALDSEMGRLHHRGAEARFSCQNR